MLSVVQREDKAAAWKLPGINHPQDIFAPDFEQSETHTLAVSLSIDLTKVSCYG